MTRAEVDRVVTHDRIGTHYDAVVPSSVSPSRPDGRLSSIAPVRGLAWFYIWFVRGTPLILQLVFLYDALPPLGVKLSSFTTAVVGFALNEAAFMAEIIRGGIRSVDRKQSIAAAAFGMNPTRSMLFIGRGRPAP